MRKLLTCMFSMFPNEVINDDQNPNTPLGRWVGHIDVDTDTLRTRTIANSILIEFKLG